MRLQNLLTMKCVNSWSSECEVNTIKMVKSSMARSLPVENLLPQNVGPIINYLQQSTEVAQWGTPSCSRLHPATDNGTRVGTFN